MSEIPVKLKNIIGRIIFRNKWVIIFSFLFCSQSLFSQQRLIDSLEHIITTMPEDISYVNILIDLSYNYNNTSFEKTKEYAEKALQRSEKLGYKKGITRSYSQLGQLYYRQGLYDLSTENHYKSLQISEEIADTVEIGRSYNNIGNVYRKQKQFEQALENYEKSIVIKRSVADSDGVATTYKNIAAIFIEKGNYEGAREYLFRSLRIVDSTKEFRVMGDIYDYFGDIGTALNDVISAENYFLKAIEIHKQINDDYGIARSSNGLGMLSMKMKNYEKAVKYYKSALGQTERIRINYERAKSFFGLYEIYTDLNNYKEANKYLQEYKLLSDSLFGEKVRVNISALKSKYEIAKKESEIVLLSKEKQLTEKRNSNLYTIVIFTVVFLSAVLTFLFFLSSNRSKIQKQAREIMIANDAKDKLFAIIAHDLRNPVGNILNMIQVMEEERDNMSDDELQEFISLLRDNAEKTYTLLENLLQWTMSQTKRIIMKPRVYELKKLIDENVATFSGIARTKSISLHSEVPDKLTGIFDWDTINTALRNLISNAIKFTRANGEIIVSAILENDNISITVADTGIGMTEEIRKNLFRTATTSKGTGGEKGTGLGLTLCKEFIEKNGGKISVESKHGEGSKFVFTVPAK